MSHFDAAPVSPSPTPSSPHPSYEVSADFPQRFAAFHRDSLRYRRVSPATAKWYRDTFRTFTKYLRAVGISRLDAASAPAIIREWLASAQDGARPISAFSARSYWQALRAFFVYLANEDGFPNPFLVVEVPITPDVLPKSLEYEDCVRVLAAARNTDWASRYERARAVAMLAMALYAGLRRKEILGLEFDDVQIAARRIVIKHGKGRAGGSQRVGYINAELADILLDYVEARKEAKLASVEFFTAIVPRRGGGRAAAAMRKDPEIAAHSGHGVQARTFNRIVARVRQTAGFRFSLHMLRHSFVSMLARQPGVTVQHIRELAGHRDMKTTERYMRLFEEDKLRAVETLSFMPDREVDPRPDGASGSPARTPARRHGYSA